jgi:hypothetical protein
MTPEAVITGGRLSFGPRGQLFDGEFNRQWPKPALVKIIGE